MKTVDLSKRVTRQLISRLARRERGLRKKTGRLIFYLSLFYVVYLFCAGDYGLFRIHRLVQQRETLKEDYMAIVAEATDYAYYLRRFKTDPHFVEWLARTRYRYSRSDEIIYHLNSRSR